MIFNFLEKENILTFSKNLLLQNSGITPAIVTKIRKQFPQISLEELKVIIDIAVGSIHAQQSGKFSQAYSDWLFTKQTYEQSTSEFIAEHHASKFKNIESILEICTGAGIDTSILAKTGKPVVTIESNKLISNLAIRNFTKHHLNNITLLQGEAENIIDKTINLDRFKGLWADPSRRASDGKRLSIIESDYQPNLRWLLNLSINGIMGIKISSAINLDYLPDGWKREWIGYKNECKEQILWKNCDVQEGTISLIDKHSSWSPDYLNIKPTEIVIPVNKVHYLVDPHSCLVRSGYLAEFYHKNNIGLFDHRIGYGIGNSAPDFSDFYSIFEIIEQSDFNYKYLQNRILTLNWNKETEIKKRGFPELPDEVRKKLRFSNGDEKGVIILSKIDNKKIVFLAKRILL
ncbi:MAG: hypothetical protein JST20_06545 [Bacteroidetes bacterium]|nr:hypothetical protein [Bacteroidota bacterium]